ncbi:hypothetical protein Misp06_02319 [Microbulbifer sp. NBRC 101763]|uniref:DUF6279 family lipoprotein n=1 Tax=Microbulbifer TaxID=48073 RepID=UPI00036306E4|nr:MULTISPECIES: DUF6279 family lipoprotein [Microbulbifer]WHI52151.1 DUF6279 family lipoprotein [Microbulbifer sp. MLAF003]
MAKPAGTPTFVFWRNVALIVTLLLISSCSSIQFVYNNVDYWIRWKANDYVNLDRIQKGELQAALQSFFRWHRQTQLPRYADFLTNLADRVDEGGLENPQLEPVEKQVELFLNSASENAYNLLLPIAAQLNDEQVDELQGNLLKEDQKKLKKWQQSPEKIRRKRDKQIRKESVRWLGSLTEEQKNLIAAMVSKMEYNPMQRSEQRLLWQAKAMELLRTKPTDYLDKLRSLLLNPEQLWSPQYQQAQEKRKQQARELAKQILLSTSPAQRSHLSNTLREYAQDFRTLASQ